MPYIFDQKLCEALNSASRELGMSECQAATNALDHTVRTGRYFRPSKARMLRIFELIFVAHHMKVDDVVHADPEKLPSDWNDAVARSGTPRS